MLLSNVDIEKKYLFQSTRCVGSGYSENKEKKKYEIVIFLYISLETEVT